MGNTASGRLAELFTRSPANPVLTAGEWPYPANAVFNPGAATVDGQTLLLCRVEDRRGLSHLTVARSADGISDWQIATKPLLADDPRDRASSWGVEDARLTRVDEIDAWVIAYTAYGPDGPCVALASTADFESVQPLGVVMPPEDKNASLLPRRIGDQFVLFHRPVSATSGRADVWLSRSADLRSWTAPEPVLGARPGPWWDGTRVGMGPPPLETDRGWLAFYHGVKQTVAGPIYRVGVALLDLENPARVLARSDEWLLSPDEPYEHNGDVPNVVFPTGLVHDPAGNQVTLYYGAADSCIGAVSASLSDLLGYLDTCTVQAAQSQ